MINNSLEKNFLIQYSKIYFIICKFYKYTIVLSILTES